ncbi:MAG: hypothetical protein ABIU54_03055 [Candidatus Eisenbacteria bacterium]
MLEIGPGYGPLLELLRRDLGYTNAKFAQVECFEERIPTRSIKGVLANLFRAGARQVQRVIYKGYELPVPSVLTPALCASATRPVEPA